MSPPNGSTSMPSWASVSAARERRGGFGRTEIDRLGHQQPLRLHRAGQHLLANLLVENPLVQRVLVDDDHPLVALGDQVAIVDLDRGGAQVVGRETVDRLTPTAAIAQRPRWTAIRRVATVPLHPRRRRGLRSVARRMPDCSGAAAGVRGPWSTSADGRACSMSKVRRVAGHLTAPPGECAAPLALNSTVIGGRFSLARRPRRELLSQLESAVAPSLVAASSVGMAAAGCSFDVRSVVRNFVRSVPKQLAVEPPAVLKAHFQLRRDAR